jgi:hypothetical protein
VEARQLDGVAQEFKADGAPQLTPPSMNQRSIEHDVLERCALRKKRERGEAIVRKVATVTCVHLPAFIVRSKI